MAQIKLNTIQIVHMAHYKKLLIRIIHMARICKNDMIQVKDMFQVVAMWLQFSTEESLFLLLPNDVRRKGEDGLGQFGLPLFACTNFYQSTI